MTPYYSDASITIYHGNCREILPTLAPVAHVITDPPYSAWVHANAMRATARSYSHVEIDFASLDETTRLSVGAEIVRLASRWALVFSDEESTHLWRSALFDMDYTRTGVWVRLGGAPQFTGDRPAAGYEPISIFHRRGVAKRWNGGGRAAVWAHPVIRPRREHPTEKPETLMIELVALFSDPGETILDPFCGVGSTLSAAKRLGRNAIGIELDERYCEVAADRCRQHVFEFGEAR